MNLQDKIAKMSFKQWRREHPENRALILLTAVAAVIQFVCFKLLYPHPNFLPDSYSYIEAAFVNRTVNMWPVGYSNFLRLVSCFTKSHTVLVLLQYLLLQVAVLYFLLTISYQFRLNKWIVRVLLVINLLNPLLLHVSNFVSSDALFAALSLVWFTQLLWILYKPDMKVLLVHGLVLLLAFIVRYNALYYPIISVAVIVLANIGTAQKTVGLAFSILLLAGFTRYTIQRYKIVTDIAQFSAFSGWQLSSNALFSYAHAGRLSVASVPAEYRPLHAIVNRHLDSLDRVPHRPDKTPGIYYLWNEQSPLKEYMRLRYKNDTVTTGFKQWASMAPLYNGYGAYLIKQRPGAFASHYIWPNMIRYYVPDPEFLGAYNMGKDTVDAAAVEWFGLKSNKVHGFREDKIITISAVLPLVLAIINLVFVVSFAGCVILGMFRKSSAHLNHSLLCMLAIWALNFGFSVFASPIVLRYQVFPMISTLSFLVILISFIVRESRSPQTKAEPYSRQPSNEDLSAQLL